MEIWPGKADLEVLGLTLPNVGNEVYIDDGFVKSLSKQVKKIKKKYNDSTKWPGFNWCLGLHYRVSAKIHSEEKGEVSSFLNNICYLKKQSPLSAVFIRGHEETHVMDSWSGGRYMSLLSEKIKQERGLDIDFSRINNSEVRANIGGLHALISRGHGLKDEPIILGFDDIAEAIDVYCLGNVNYKSTQPSSR